MRVVDPGVLAKRVRQARLGQGLSQEELAGEAYSAAYISHVEHGKRNPSYEALSYFAQRLGMTYDQLVTGRDPDSELRLEIGVQEAMAGIHRGDPQGAERRLRSCLDEALEMAADRVARRAREGIAQCLFRQGRIGDALAQYETLAAELPEDAYEERTSAVVGSARCLFQRGDALEAIDLLETHEVRLTRSPAPDPTALLQVYSGLIGPYVETGRMDKAKAVALKGGDIAPKSGDVEQLACLYINRAGLLLQQKQPREALMFLARAEDSYKQLGWEAEAANVGVARGIALLEHNDLEQARALFTSLLHDEHDRVSQRLKMRSLTSLAQVERRSDAARAGLALAQEAISLMTVGDLHLEAAEATREAGLCARALGDGDEALRYLKDALALYRDHGDRTECAKTATFIGDLLIERGDAEEAAAAYREGLSAMGELR